MGGVPAKRAVRDHAPEDGERLQALLPVRAEDAFAVVWSNLRLEDAVEQPVAVLEVLRRVNQRRGRDGVQAELALEVQLLMKWTSDGNLKPDAAETRAFIVAAFLPVNGSISVQWNLLLVAVAFLLRPAALGAFIRKIRVKHLG